MKILVQIIYVIIAAGIPSLCAVVLMLRPEDRSKITNPPVRTKQRETEELLAPSGGYWSVEFQESMSRKVFRKIFRRRLMIGRRIDNQEYTGVLFLDKDTDISRRQFELAVTGEGIILNNLSASNPTLHNGRIVDRPVFVHVGDDITIAGHHYIILSIRREPALDR